jgi:hypothetical protein
LSVQTGIPSFAGMPVYFGSRATLVPLFINAVAFDHRCIPLLSQPADDRQGGNNLARSNYSFQKRQKELARKKKKEEKRKRKLEKNAPSEEETEETAEQEQT